MTVKVGLKLPNGIIMSAIVDGKVMEMPINGWNKSPIHGADHGITHDVPKVLWDAWLEKFKEGRLVKGGFIFAHKSEQNVKAEATEKKDNKSGTEQLAKPSGKAKEGTLESVEGK